ncbi:hypothetical protein J7T55_006618 [Diaporthe amygdali]|uniref:uncharacterized protein n=1 Tax=Phomopsis amygdali TaxID=1214568 RepID=UPI0022FEDB18|nr:uncharacterized protein J7T55_006618 [Diaporthe amygdali]KAJ0125273.1 hypothetical protein J7T55_006618 [Diaporthe amygdali]
MEKFLSVARPREEPPPAAKVVQQVQRVVQALAKEALELERVVQELAREELELARAVLAQQEEKEVLPPEEKPPLPLLRISRLCKAWASRDSPSLDHKHGFDRL